MYLLVGKILMSKISSIWRIGKHSNSVACSRWRRHHVHLGLNSNSVNFNRMKKKQNKYHAKYACTILMQEAHGRRRACNPENSRGKKCQQNLKHLMKTWKSGSVHYPIPYFHSQPLYFSGEFGERNREARGGGPEEVEEKNKEEEVGEIVKDEAGAERIFHQK